MGHVGDGHRVGIHAGAPSMLMIWPVACVVMLGRVDADVGAGGDGDLDLQEVHDPVGVDPRPGTDSEQSRIVVEAPVEVAGAARGGRRGSASPRPCHPPFTIHGKNRVEGVRLHVVPARPVRGSGNTSARDGQAAASAASSAQLKVPYVRSPCSSAGVGVGLLVALQVVPAGEDHPAEAVDDRLEVARRRVVEELAGRPSAGSRLQSPVTTGASSYSSSCGYRWPLAVARPVGGEEDAVVGGVDRADVVRSRRLVRHLGDRTGLRRAEAGHLVELPVVGRPIVLRGRRADDHAEDRLGAAPVHGRLAHRDRVRPLEAAALRRSPRRR